MTYPFDLDFLLLLSSGRQSSDLPCTTSISMTSTALFFRSCWRSCCCWWCCCWWCCDLSPTIVPGSDVPPEVNPLNLCAFEALVSDDSEAAAGGIPLPWKAWNAEDGTMFPLAWPWYAGAGPHFEEQPAPFGGIAPEVGDNPKAGWFKWLALGAAPPAIDGKKGEWPYFWAARLEELDSGFPDSELAVGPAEAAANGWCPGFDA